MARNIVLFSDGTGNSASKLFKTNVWRLYQTLDLQPIAGEPTQLPYHDDGVGTSSLGLFALLGGAFGYGLKRNVLDLYCFLSRHYQDGDQIYAFGFSRGAFTIRVLVGLIANQGIVQAKTEIERRWLANQAFWAYLEDRHCRSGRRGPLSPFFLKMRKWLGLSPATRLPLVRLSDQRQIRFLGLWDTVSAYGGSPLTIPLIDCFYPVRFADHQLTKHVVRACHALALDDERRSFHPEIWDESQEDERRRISQVWFAGMHSNVGGSYPDDGMSLTSLLWMIDQAREAGLRFNPLEVQRLESAANPNGKMYDSRRGLGGAYLYSPRHLAASPHPPQIHASVFHRIENQSEGYAPIVLPPQFEIVSSGQKLIDPLKVQRWQSIAAELPGRVCPLISSKKRAQVLGLAAGVGLLLMPIFSRLGRWLAGEGTKAAEFLAPLRAINERLYQFFASFEQFNGGVSSIWQLLGEYLLPALAVRYVGYFLDRPLYVLPLLFSLLLAIAWGKRAQRQIQESAQQAWYATSSTLGQLTPED
jgi:uncharacterized protein (DUF2235 family)